MSDEEAQYHAQMQAEAEAEAQAAADAAYEAHAAMEIEAGDAAYAAWKSKNDDIAGECCEIAFFDGWSAAMDFINRDRKK